MAQAARMTDTGGMELLEREPSLVLAKLGAPNRNAAAAQTAKLGLGRGALRAARLHGHRRNDPAGRASEITDQINPGTFGPIHCQGIRAAVRPQH